VQFAETVKQKSNGKIEVQVAPSAQLGDDAAMITALRTGTLDISANSQGATAVLVPEYGAFGLPFLFSEPAQAFKLLDGPLGKELARKQPPRASSSLVIGTMAFATSQTTRSQFRRRRT
jgi:TRAP-type C4-dicarboxylate transport system substrate-binding protein